TAFVGPQATSATVPVDAAVRSLSDEAAAVRKRLAERRRVERAADVVTAFKARQSAGELLQRSFDLKAAETLLGEASAALKTPEFRAVLAAEVASLASAARVRDAWIASTKSAGKEIKLKLPTGGDRRRLADFTLVAADEKGFTAKRGPSETAFPFSGFSAAEACDLLFKDVLEKNEALRVDALATLLLAGRADRALELAEQLPEGPVRTSLVDAARREAEGWRLLAEIRELAAKTETDDAYAVKLLRAVNRLLDEFQDTRASLIHRRDPPAGA
ncbi:MAG TPA: hypothetical protein VEI02_05815, partial [Planctomycetota bacterium]|nr:hypothetical protein [Planctomycetota bacterium]